MEITAVVLHKGALAHYAVHSEQRANFEAHLLQYNGALENEPPHDIVLQKAGRHCTGSTEEQDLMDDICNAVECKEEKEGGSMVSSPNP
jgi:hypothetical protein